MKRPLRLLVVAVTAGMPLLLVAAADLVFVPAAEARLEHRARTATKSASVEAEVGSFPVLGRGLALGEVGYVDLTWFGVQVGALQATSLNLRFEGVGFDRGKLLAGDAHITGAEAGTVRMLISAAQLSRLLPGELKIEARRMRVRLSAETVVDVEASATNRGLVLVAPGIDPVTAEFGTDDIPCAPTVKVEAPNLVLECEFRGLPPILRGRLVAA